MEPIKFPEANIVMGEGQPEYLPLPAHKEPGPDGEVISCWKLSLWERLIVLFTGRLWLHIFTFNHPLQPQFMQVYFPFPKRGKNE